MSPYQSISLIPSFSPLIVSVFVCHVILSIRKTTFILLPSSFIECVLRETHWARRFIQPPLVPGRHTSKWHGQGRHFHTRTKKSCAPTKKSSISSMESQRGQADRAGRISRTAAPSPSTASTLSGLIGRPPAGRPGCGCASQLILLDASFPHGLDKRGALLQSSSASG